MIRIEKLSIGIKKKKEVYPVINQLDLAIPRGKISILTGESGVGKTVFAKAISGLLPENFFITEGLIYIDNREINYNEIKKLTGKRIFYSPQNAKASLNPVLKIRTQFKDISDSRDKISKLMKDLSFDDPERILNSYPFELSEGECQRIIFAMGLLLAPELFILDEPTTALDGVTQGKILDIILKINQKYKTSILLITHNVSLLDIKDKAGNHVSFYHHHMVSK